MVAPCWGFCLPEPIGPGPPEPPLLFSLLGTFNYRRDSFGFTDSHFFRDLGIVSYGYSATATPMEDDAGVHGNDERVTEENVRRGVEMTLKILERFAATRPIRD